MYEGSIPFSKDGNQLHYAKSYEFRCGAVMQPVMQPNAKFTDTLTFRGFLRGRSAAYAEFTRQNGTTVVVFLTDLDDIIKRMQNGIIQGEFCFCKRGRNYGCQLAK